MARHFVSDRNVITKFNLNNFILKNEQFLSLMFFENKPKASGRQPTKNSTCYQIQTIKLKMNLSVIILGSITLKGVSTSEKLFKKNCTNFDIDMKKSSN